MIFIAIYVYILVNAYFLCIFVNTNCKKQLFVSFVTTF